MLYRIAVNTKSQKSSVMVLARGVVKRKNSINIIADKVGLEN